MAWPKELIDLLPNPLPKPLRGKYRIVKRRPWLRNILIATPVLILAVIAGTYYFTFHYTGYLNDDRGQPIDLSKPSRQSFKLASHVKDNGGKIIGRYFEEIRDPVKITEIPELLQKAFIAAEDQRFYSHPGVDPLAILRALGGNLLLKVNLRYLKNSGASGIAQQYSRLIYADDFEEFKNRERNIWRKIKEARVAIQLVKRYPREKILEDILNMIYFGHGVNGVAEAAWRYFGKDIRKDELTLKEITILVSLNKSSALYCPIFHKPEEPKTDKTTDQATIVKLKEKYESELAKEIIRIARARERYNWVLGRMLDEGYISQEESKSALFEKDKPLETEFVKVQPLKDRSYGYSNRVVKEFLLSQGRTEEELSYSGGLQIFTTIDSGIQKITSEEFEKHLVLVNQGGKPENRLNGAFVVMEVKTGNILALSGGNNFDETEYNRVFAPRSPGSAAKVFTFAAALEYHDKDLFDKVCNCSFKMKGGKQGEFWIPRNFEEKNPVPLGYIDLATAWFRSVNLATLNEAREVGMLDVIRAAHAMGVWGNPGIVRDPDGNIWFRRPGYKINKGLEPTLPTAIGASETNLIEMANAFMTFFRNGEYITPTLVKKIKSAYGNKVLYKPEPYPPKRVFSPETSDKIVAMMRAVTKIGTAKISMRGIEQEVACKTGTSNGPRDLSIYCGSPEIFLAMWFGHDNYDAIELPEYMRKVSGDANMNVSGGWVAGPLARRMMDRYYESRPNVRFSENVEIQHQRILDRNH